MLEPALDGATTLLALAARGGSLALDAALERIGLSRRSVPASCDEITAAWLTRALQRDFPGSLVAAAETIDQHAGTTDRCRLRLSYGKESRAGSAPPSVFVKLTPRSLGARLFGDLMGLGQAEVRFYREIAREIPVEVPRCHYAVVTSRSSRFVLVLEDLAARGARFRDVSERADAETARRVALALARLHAAYSGSARLRSDLSWLKGPDENPTLRLERALCRAAVGRGLRRFPDLVPAELLSAWPRIVAARDRLDAYWSTQPLTLIHGDSHIGNLYFIGERVGFLDWQVVQRGPGLRDLSYFLITSLPVEIRREHERAILGEYLSALRDAGGAPPAFDLAWEQHRLHAFHAFVAAAVTAAARELQPDPVARAGLARACAALTDLESLRALERLGA